MKKQVFILVTLLLPLVASAYDLADDKGLFYNLKGDGTLELVGLDAETTTADILSDVTIGGVEYRVTSIGERAFEGRSDLTYLSIPWSVTSIGEYAFIDCGSNITVNIADPESWCQMELGNEHSSPLSSAGKVLVHDIETISIIIPEGVTSIGNFTFYQCRCITSLTIPSSVKSIGSSAFEDCSGLTSLTLSEGLESIGGSAFEGCIGLKMLRIPSTVNTISINAFKNCTGIMNVYCFAVNVPVTDDNAFDGTPTENSTLHVLSKTIVAYGETWPWSDFKEILAVDKRSINGGFQYEGIYYKIIDDNSVSVTNNGGSLYYGNIVIPAHVTYEGRNYSVTAIGRGAFHRCQGLTSLIIPDGVRSVGYRAFHGCRALTNITFPNSIESLSGSSIQATPWYKNQPDGIIYVGRLAYKYKGKMPSNTRITLKSGIKMIADSAFYSCNGLVSVTIPNSVSSIGNAAFCRCSGLTSIDIPNSVTRIGRGAFMDCSGLTSINIPSSVISIGSNAFLGTSWYASQPDGLVYAGKVAYYYKGNMPANTNISIKEGTLGIGDYAFSHCSGLTSISIPISVIDIGIYAFQDCSGLTSVSIPDGVISISEGLFSECSDLKSINIPNNVTIIGGRAFESCSSLNSISIPNSVTSIGSSAFAGCISLTSVSIPNSITSIESNAFRNCSGLASMTVPGSVSVIDNYAFSGCNGLNSVTICDGVICIGNGAFSNCSALSSLIIASSVVSIRNDAFSGTAWYDNQPEGLVYAGKVAYKYKGEMLENTSLSIKEGTLGIADYAFYDCKNLSSVLICSSMTSIGSSAFKGCSGLTTMTIPNSVINIGSYAFSGCYGLVSTNIPNSLINISSGTFSGCSSLESVNIPNSVTTISRHSFANCVSLSTIVIPKSVTDIGGYAFYDCFKLVSVVSKIDKPFVINDTVFYGIPSNAQLMVPKGTSAAYKSTSGWKKFKNIKDRLSSDINLDEEGNKEDLIAVVDYIMGKNPDNFYECIADLNDDEYINAADVVKLINILNTDGLSTDWEISFENINGSIVVSSLTCTLHNERAKAIQLTKCELYCNQNLVNIASYTNQTGTISAGGSMQRTFNSLSNLSSKTGFYVIWHYTYDGEEYSYRCDLTE